jgi:hypothetical protein
MGVHAKLDLYCEGTLKPVARWDKYIPELGGNSEK